MSRNSQGRGFQAVFQLCQEMTVGIKEFNFRIFEYVSHLFVHDADKDYRLSASGTFQNIGESLSGVLNGINKWNFFFNKVDFRKLADQ